MPSDRVSTHVWAAAGGWRVALVRAAALCVLSPWAMGGERALHAQLPARGLTIARRYVEPFSDITALRVLSDGRALLFDGKEQALQLVDLGRGTHRAFGRVRAGPGEYRRATALLAAPGDTTWLAHGGNGRLLVVAPEGILPGVLLPFDRVPLTLATAADDRGHDYATMALPGDTAISERAPDSVRLARIDVAGRRVTTVTTVAAPPTSITITLSGTRIESVQVRRTPFAVGDAFSVAPNGRIAIARRSPYRLEQVMPDGRVVRGPVVPVRPVPVGERERANYVAGLVRRPPPEALEWSRELPPFPTQPVLALANGDTWVRRHEAVARDSTWYDMCDASGTVRSRLVVPRAMRVLAVSSHGVWVARTDEDGLVELAVAMVVR